MERPQWVRLPTDWIRVHRGLKNFEWKLRKGADNVAALILLIVIAHHADADNGLAKLNYDQLQQLTELSRAKIAAGLAVLTAQSLIIRDDEGRSSYRLAHYNLSGGWGKLPAQGLYKYGVAVFRDFHLRRSVGNYVLDNGSLMGNASEGQAGANKDEIDITPEMIEAGATILLGSGRLRWNVADWAVLELAGDIFRAMMKSSVPRPGA